MKRRSIRCTCKCIYYKTKFTKITSKSNISKIIYHNTQYRKEAHGYTVEKKCVHTSNLQLLNWKKKKFKLKIDNLKKSANSYLQKPHQIQNYIQGLVNNKLHTRYYYFGIVWIWNQKTIHRKENLFTSYDRRNLTKLWPI
jgi:hypothetical protein